MKQTPEITAILKALEKDILKQKPKKDLSNYNPYNINDVYLPGSTWFIHQ